MTQIDDWVAIAERLVASPYRWGGRCAWGLDCSALVQLALAAGGIDVPRDSGPQHHIGSGIDDLSQLQRGDLVFWHGHVGIMQDRHKPASCQCASYGGGKRAASQMPLRVLRSLQGR